MGTVPWGEWDDNRLGSGPAVLSTALLFVSTTTVVVAAGVAAGVTLVLLLLFVAARAIVGSRGTGEDAVATAVAELNARMETMGRELGEALERTREETRRTRALGELAGSIDLDEVLNRTLDAAGALPGVDAALINVLGPDDEPLMAAVGLSPEEAEAYALGSPTTGTRIRSLAIAYEPEHDPLAVGETAIQSGLAVPIGGELETLGLLSVFARGPAHGLGEGQVRELEALALRAGPAIENARSFREARHLADLDALTGLHNRRYFHETLAREVSRAQRYGRSLALVVFDLDDFKAINDRIGHLAGDSVLAEVADRMRAVVRHADVACRVGGDEFAVILPESSLHDAEQLYERIYNQVWSRPITHGGQLGLSAGVAELRPQDDPVTFFQRADKALYAAKGRGKGQFAGEATGGADLQGPSAISGIQSSEA